MRTFADGQQAEARCLVLADLIRLECLKLPIETLPAGARLLYKRFEQHDSADRRGDCDNSNCNRMLIRVRFHSKLLNNARHIN